jgi:hypothetical protein
MSGLTRVGTFRVRREQKPIGEYPVETQCGHVTHQGGSWTRSNKVPLVRACIQRQRVKRDAALLKATRGMSYEGTDAEGFEVWRHRQVGPPLCSICRDRHGSEIVHECE